MDKSGQVFTLDMFFALTLTVLVVSYSGLALEQARRQADTYALRYSLERTANDAADVLVKTLGRPYAWEENIETLETPGFAESIKGNAEGAAQNTLDVGKFGQLKRLCKSTNWNPMRSEVQAVLNLFGDSDNFELTLLDKNGNVLSRAWPGWDVEASSGVENSFEVTVVKRSIAMRYGDIRYQTSKLERRPGTPKDQSYQENWFIGEDELELFDWYIVLKTGVEKTGRIESAFIFLNRPIQGPADYHYTQAMGSKATFPEEHGGIENDLPDPPRTGYIREGWNTINVRITSGQVGDWVEIYIVALPACSSPDVARLALYRLPATLEVKLWR